MDVICPKCQEPWDVYHVNHDMEPADRERFKRGEGCESCHFGSYCPRCNGFGGESWDFPATACKLCRGSRAVLAWNPSNSAGGFLEGHFYTGYSPNVRHLGIEGNVEEIRTAAGHESADGWVTVSWLRCPDCKADPGPACSECGGDGKLHREADAAQGLETLLDATDEEPIGLIEGYQGLDG